MLRSDDTISTSGEPRNRRQIRIVVACGLLSVAVLLTHWLPWPVRHLRRPLGYKGSIRIPWRNVFVTFDGGSCVVITKDGTSNDRCCIGHDSCQEWFGDYGVVVVLKDGWFDIRD